MKIAKRAPFEGKPLITAAAVFGGAPRKPLLFRLPAIGARPIKFTAENLPDGLTLGENGVISGVCEPTERIVTVSAENSLGRDSRKIRFIIADGSRQLTPLLGFTTWNAYGMKVTQNDVESVADMLIASGIADYGYNYVNLDSSWQYAYGGSHDAIIPCGRFPDMKAMCEHIHSRGLLAGIYSTPMLTAWGCPDWEGAKSIPGCTRGEPDPRYEKTMGGIGLEHSERNNVAQWCEWGFDYLKYDWSPCSADNAELMKRELRAAPRDFAFCVTVAAKPEYADYWAKNCTSWRNNFDTNGGWEKHKFNILSWDNWREYSKNGHYYDLDMLDIGQMEMFECSLTEDEKILVYTARAFLMSPIQISCKLESLTEFEKDLLCNEEIIAVSQDSLTAAPELIKTDEELRIYLKPLEDGNTACALVNLSDTEREICYKPAAPCRLRDLWLKRDLGVHGEIKVSLPPHSCAAYKLINSR